MSDLARRKGLTRTAKLQGGGQLQRGAGLQRGDRINPVSGKRRVENRERRAMADRRWPDRRDGTVMCTVPGCGPADDLHEILPRGRGGSITDEDNTAPVCRQHNEELTLEPPWGYQLGLLKHSGLCCQDRAVCAQYAPPGEAA